MTRLPFIRNRMASTASAVLAALFLASCGGSSSNDSSPGGGGGLAAGGFTKTFDTADDGDNAYPFIGTFDLKVQLLYTAAEINGSGNITTLRMRRSGIMAADVTCPNVTIRLGQTSLTALTNTFATNVEQGKGTQVDVLTDTTVTIPAGAGGTWFDIPLSTSFAYNGVDNLVVEFDKTTACSANAFADTYTAGSNRRASSSATDTTAGVAEHNTVTASVTDVTQNWMQFVFSGGAETVTSSDQTADNANNIAPGRTGRTQFLLLAGDIDGSGPITGIAFYPDSTTAATDLINVSMKMVHVDPATTSLSATFEDNYAGQTPVTVVQGLSFGIPAAQSDPFWVPLTGFFSYNGTSNLLIDVSTEVTTGGFVVDYKNVPASRTVISIDPVAATGSAVSRALQPVLRFNGGTIDTVVGIGGSDAARTFNTSVTGGNEQYLYRASELGTGGSITKMACRMTNASSTATDYPNFQVVLGHTTLNALTNTYVDNVLDPTTVFNGTFSLPAGLVQGDWIEIPFTTPFTYDGTRNLVVQTLSDAGASAHNCSVLSDAARYPTRRLNSTDRTTLTGTNFTHLRDQRLWISK